MKILKQSNIELDKLLILKKLSSGHIVRKYGFSLALRSLMFYFDSYLSSVVVLTPLDVSESVLIDEDERISKLILLGYKVRRIYISDNPASISSAMMRIHYNSLF